MDIENFEKWSGQFSEMLTRLSDHENELQMAKSQTTHLLSECQTQVAIESYLRKMASDIRALGFCYNNLRRSIHMQQEQFDSLD